MWFTKLPNNFPKVFLSSFEVSNIVVVTRKVLYLFCKFFIFFVVVNFILKHFCKSDFSKVFLLVYPMNLHEFVSYTSSPPCLY